MAPTVWKYNLPTRGGALLPMPLGARVLCVQQQHGELVLWALVEPLQVHEPREFIVALTGAPIRGLYQVFTYIGTVQFNNGAFVAHVFEVKR